VGCRDAARAPGLAAEHGSLEQMRAQGIAYVRDLFLHLPRPSDTFISRGQSQERDEPALRNQRAFASAGAVAILRLVVSCWCGHAHKLVRVINLPLGTFDVTLTGPDDKQSKKEKQKGSVKFSNLSPGKYHIEWILLGFNKQGEKEIELQVPNPGMPPHQESVR